MLSLYRYITVTILPSSGQSFKQTNVLFLSAVSRGMWRVTSGAAGLQKPWPQSRWFFNRWPVTLPQDCCTCTNTTSRTGTKQFLLLNYKITTTSVKPWSVKSACCFLEQYPGAAWVLLTDSSISDFVAGGDHVISRTTQSSTQSAAPSSGTGVGFVCFQLAVLRLAKTHYFIFLSVSIFTCRASKYFCPSLKKIDPRAMF